MTPNFIKLKRWSLFKSTYAYIDTKEHTADRFFIQEKIPVFYFSQEITEAKADGKYSLVFCKIRKKDEKKFTDVLMQLENKLILLGFRDYKEACENVFKALGMFPAQEEVL